MNAARGPDRRQALLGGAALLAGAAVGPACASRRRPARDDNVLVLLELTGGNDGLSTVVPLDDDAYHRARPTIALSEGEVLQLDEHTGLHPALRRVRTLYQSGHVGIVEGVGYPEATLSHFRSLEVWHAGRLEGRAAGAGWIGRVRETAWGDDERGELCVHVGEDPLWALYSERRPPLSFRVAETLRWQGAERDREAYVAAAGMRDAPGEDAPRLDLLARLRGNLRSAQESAERVLAATEAYRPQVEYPSDALAQALRQAAALIQSDLGVRVVSSSLGNFDFHGGILRARQELLLGQLDRSLGAFLADLAGTQAAGRVLVVCYSEFGRRVDENEAGGTDHGAAGPLLLLGQGVRGGRWGARPPCAQPDERGNLVPTTDFRSVYQAVLEGWLGVDPQPVLGERFDELHLLRA